MIWTDVENALHAWAVSTSGLAAGNVLWALQQAPRPQTPYISLRLRQIRQLGQDWVDIIQVATPGAELEHKIRGIREFTLSLQCFSAVGTGAASAVQILEQVTTKSQLLAVREALDAADVSLNVFSPVRGMDGILNSTLVEPRALLDIRGYVLSEITETSTYIETAGFDGDISE